MPAHQNEIDKKLVLSFQSGNKQAINELVKRWHKTFCEKAYWLVKDADIAKDITQDSWNTIISKINGLEKPESFSSWGLRIVCNKSFDWLNKNKRVKRHLDQIKNEQETQILIDESNSNDQLKAKLLEVFKKLPGHQQTVIQLILYRKIFTLRH